MTTKLLFATSFFLFSSFVFSQNDSDVCRVHSIQEFVSILAGACTEVSCDIKTLKLLDHEIKRSTLWESIKTSDFQPVHIFFPKNKFRLEDSLDWNARKRDQLETLTSSDKHNHCTIFILGRASNIGESEYNFALSKRRMQSVLDFINNKINVCEIRGAWLGKDIFQLEPTDANFLFIPEVDYRSDPLILNQSVHVFVYPCYLSIPD